MVQRNVDIILRARDQVTSVLQNVNNAIDRFGRETKQAQGETAGAGDAFNRLGNAIRNLDRNLSGIRIGGEVTQGVNQARQAYEGLQRSVREALTETGRYAQAQRRQAGSVRELESAVESLNAELAQQQATLAASGASQRTINRQTQALRATLKEQEGALRAARVEETRLANARARSAQSLGQSNAGLAQARAGLRATSAEANQAAQAYERAGVAVRRSFLEAFREQVQRVQGLNQAFRESSASAQRYAQDIRRVAQPSAELAAAFEKARNAAAQTRQEFRAQRVILQQLRGVLRTSGTDVQALAANQQRFAAGLDQATRQFAAYEARVAEAARETDRLAQAQRRATAAATPLAGATRQAARATRQGATATLTLAQAWEQFYGRGTRQSLSLIQRIRGQVLSLAAAYVGLFGVIRGFQNIVEVFTVIEAAQTRLNAAFGGDTQRVGDAFQRLERTAARLGIQFGTLAQEYSAFAVATQGTALEGERTERIFRQVSEAARVNNLSIDQTRGVFTALSQIVSKGTLSMEELRQQLGDRIPGAVRIYADALDLSVEQLFKLVEAGAISSDTLSDFGNELERRFGGESLARSLNTIGAAFGRLQNAAFQATRTLGEAGAIDSLRNLFDQTARTIRSADFDTFLQNLGRAAAAVTDAFGFLIRNFELLTAAAGFLVASRLSPFFLVLITSVRRLPLAFALATAAIGSFRGALTGVSASAAGAAASMGALRTALSFAAGPGLGLALGVIGGAIALWASRASEAEKALEGVEAVVTRISNVLDRSGDAEQFFEGVIGEVSQGEIQAQIRQLEDLRTGVLDTVQRRTAPGFFSGVTPSFREFREAVLDLLVLLNDGELEVADFNRELDRLQTEGLAGLAGGSLRRTSEDMDEFLIVVGEAVEELDGFADRQQRLEAVARGLTGSLEDQSDAYDELQDSIADVDVAQRASVRAARSLGSQANSLIRQRIALTQRLFRQYAQGASEVEIAESEAAVEQLTDRARSRLVEAVAALREALGDLADTELTAPLRAALQSEIATYENSADDLDTALRRERSRFFESQLRAYQAQARTIRDAIQSDIEAGGTLGDNQALVIQATDIDDRAVQQAQQAIDELRAIEQITPDIIAQIRRLESFITSIPADAAAAIINFAQAEIGRLVDLRNDIQDDLIAAIDQGDTGRQQQAETDLRANTVEVRASAAALLDQAQALGIAGTEFDNFARSIRLTTDELLDTPSQLDALREELQEYQQLRGALRDNLSIALIDNDVSNVRQVSAELGHVNVAIEQVAGSLLDYIDALEEVTPELRALQLQTESLLASAQAGEIDLQLNASARRISILRGETRAIDDRIRAAAAAGDDIEALVRERHAINGLILSQVREEIRLLTERGDLTREEISRMRELVGLAAGLTEETERLVRVEVEGRARQLVGFVRELRQLAETATEFGDAAGQARANALLGQYIPLAREAISATEGLAAQQGLAGEEADRLAARVLGLNQQLAEAVTPSGPSQIEILEREFNDLQSLRDTLQQELTRTLASGDFSGANVARQELQLVEAQLMMSITAINAYADSLDEVPPALQAMQVALRGLQADLADGSVEVELEAQQQRIEELIQLREALANRPVTIGGLGQAADDIDVVNMQLVEAVENALRLAEALDASSPATQRLRLELEQVKLESQGLGNQFRISFDQIQDTLQGSIQAGLNTFIDTLVMGGSATRSLGDAFRAFAADFLRQIARMIIEQLAFNAAQAFSGGLFGGFLGIFHEGGIVGQPSLPSGGGLSSNEVFAVLEQGEAVLTENQFRAAGALAAGAGSGGTTGVTVINTVDGPSFLDEALRQRDGREVLLNAIRAERSAIRSTLGV